MNMHWKTVLSVVVVLAATVAPNSPEGTVSKQLEFSSDELFVSDLLNSSTLAFKTRRNQTETQLNTTFGFMFPSFRRVTVLSFRNGSTDTVTVTQLDFAASGPVPSNTDVATNLSLAVTEAAVTILIKTSTISVTTIVPESIVSKLFEFSNNEPFDISLDNSSSPFFINRTNLVEKELTSVLKALFPSFRRVTVLSFRNVSTVTVTVTQLDFASGSSPTDIAVFNTLRNIVSEEILNFTIMLNSISVITIEPEKTTAAPASTYATTAPASTNATTAPASTYATTAPASTYATTVPEGTVSKQLEFTSNETFVSDLLNSSTLAFKNRRNQTETQLSALFKAVFPSFRRVTVLGFRNGSIVTVTQLDFVASGSVPNNSDVATTLIEAVNAGNLTIFINTSSISATTITTPAANSTNTTTAPASTYATTAPEGTVSKQLEFTSNETFVSDLLNSSTLAFKTRTNQTETLLGALFKAVFPSFRRVTVLSYRNGSTVTVSRLDFAASGSVPNNSDVATVLIAVVNTRNLPIFINTSSISVTSRSNAISTPAPTNPTTIPATISATTIPATISATTIPATISATTIPASSSTTPAPTTASPGSIVSLLLLFSSSEAFTAALSDLNSQAFINRATLTQSEIEPVFRRAYPSFNGLFVISFRNGSVLTQSRLDFIASGSLPSNENVASTLRAAVESGQLTIPIDPDSISVSSFLPSGVSPVCPSVFSCTLLTMGSLLLAAMLNFS